MNEEYQEEYVQVGPDIFQLREEYEANMEHDEFRDNQIADGN